MRSSSIRGGLRAVVAWLRGETATWLRLLRWWPAWAALVAMLLGLTLAYQVPHTYSVDIGSAQDQLYVRNFHGRSEEETPSYRWSGVYSYVAFPGLGGSRPFTASLTLDPGRTAPVTIIVNGETLFEGELQPGWQTLNLPVNDHHPGALASRDTVLEIRAPDYRTPDAPGQPKGVKLDSAVVEQAAVGGFITPAYSALALLSGGVLLFYLFVGRALAGFASLKRARLWALLAALSLGVMLAVLLAQSHVAVAAAASHLLVTLVSMILFFLAGSLLAGKLVGRRYPVAAQGLALCLALAFGVRYGGMGLPQSVIIDMPWHMKWLRTLLAGDWQSLYFPGGLSSVPREWGLELLIPKSPLFYFAFAPLNLIPFDLETSTKWLICLLDATLVLAVFWLVLRVGGGRGAAVMGAALYAFMPLAFRAFAYGVLPTIFAQCLAVGTLLAFVTLSGRQGRWTTWLAVTLLAALALVAFPTVAVFLTMVALASVALWWLMARPRKVEWRVPLALLGAWLLATWGYYGLYVSPMIASAQALIAPKAGGSTVRWPGGFADLLAWTADYVVTLLPALLACLGLALLFVRLRNKAAYRGEGTMRVFWLLLAWASVAPVFILVNYRVDMIGKHLFFTMLPVAAAGGVALWEFGRRGRWATMLMVLAFGAVGWQALTFWVERLVRAST